MEKELDIFIHFLRQLVSAPAVKLFCGCFIWVVQLLFGTVMRLAYGAVGILWLIDTATGYYHAWANPAVVPESRRMYHGLVKLAMYYLLMMLGYQLARTGFELMIVVQATIEIAIMITEGKSILENLKKITMLKQWPTPLVALINQLLRVFEGKYQEVLHEGERHDV